MDDQNQQLVPKIHPGTRAVEPDDPMSLHATPMAGDPEVMLRMVVQEFAALGWTSEQILGLFRSPHYPVLHGLWQALGEAGVQERINAVICRVGVYQFQATVREVTEPPEPDVVQIGL